MLYMVEITASMERANAIDAGEGPGVRDLFSPILRSTLVFRQCMGTQHGVMAI
jgi:hypothetical protein